MKSPNLLRKVAIAALCLVLAACLGRSHPQVPVSHESAFTLEGQVTGLMIEGVTLSLQDHGGRVITVGSGRFRFPGAVPADSRYAVTVARQPKWHWCTVRRGESLATDDVKDIHVQCALQGATVSTLAGRPYAVNADRTSHVANDGSGAAATFGMAERVAIDVNGALIVSDSLSHTIRRITAAGVVTTQAGRNGVAGYRDGAASDARFNSPSGVAVDEKGNIYVADRGNHSIRKITSAGQVSTLAGSGHAGFADGTGSAASFKTPNGLALDARGNLYVADTGNHRIRKVSPEGVVTTLAGSGAAGWADGTGRTASFNTPMGVTVSQGGDVYVADMFNGMIRKISTAGAVVSLQPVVMAGTQAAADSVNPLRLSANYASCLVSDVAIDAEGHLYVTDGSSLYHLFDVWDGSKRWKLSLTLAGGSRSGYADGSGAEARFNGGFSAALAVGRDGAIYMTDGYNYRVRKIVPLVPAA